MIEIQLSSVDLIDRIGIAVMRWQDATEAYDEAVGRLTSLAAAERACLSLLFSGPQPAGAIAAPTALTPAAVTALVDRLEARGLVRRSRDAADRRKVMVEATEAAGEVTRRYYQPIGIAGAEFLAGSFDANELAAILRFLEGAVELQRRHLAKLEAGDK
jgi:DNA-binding MarR family transcriptional regulator